MVKELKDFSETQNEQMVLFGISYAMYEASIDKQNYAKYKAGNCEELSQENMKSSLILNILENLGYPMDELGTYLYKDVILEVMREVQSFSNTKDIEKCEKLLGQLNNMYSQFYLDIARNDKEMGLKTFHLYINEAISKINDEVSDKELVGKIFGEKNEDLTYGLQAFQLASYILSYQLYETVEEPIQPKIIALPNMPSDIRLKANAKF